MFFFVRQLGNTFGVTAATVMFDRRMTFHSSRLLDVANRIDPIVTSTLSSYSNLIHRNGGPGSVPGFGALQIFQNNVVVQSRLLVVYRYLSGAGGFGGGGVDFAGGGAGEVYAGAALFSYLVG